MGLFSRFKAKSKVTPDQAPPSEEEIGVQKASLPGDLQVSEKLSSEVIPEPKPSTASGSVPFEKSQNESPKLSWFQRLKGGLSKTRKALGGGLAAVILGRKSIDDELIEEIETILLTADIGVDLTQEIIDQLTEQVDRNTLKEPQALLDSLRVLLNQTLAPAEQALQLNHENKPTLILMVGVNGAGKTTTIGKLTHRFKSEGKRVMLAAGDTFRAAAVEQLQAWGERSQVDVVAQASGSDSASVIYDAYQSAKAKGVDVLIADTAGRLHNKSNLMNELNKVVRVIRKIDASAPHEVMLVIDAGNGQNALNQAVEFNKTVGLTGLTVTKLDGTAKGGIVFAIAKALNVPIRFIGVGEGIEDLRPFVAKDFVAALFDD